MKEPIFSSLISELEIMKIKKIFKEQTYVKGKTIFLEGEASDGIYFVLSGLLKVYSLSSDGREKTLAILGSGELIGEMSIVGNNLRSASVGAIEDSNLIFIPYEKLLYLFNEIPQFAFKIIETLSDRLRSANSQIQNLFSMNSRHRVIYALIYLSEKYGHTKNGKVLLTVRLTQVELANFAGVSRETVTKVFSELQSKQMISIKNKKITINNLVSLKEYLME